MRRCCGGRRCGARTSAASATSRRQTLGNPAQLLHQCLDFLDANRALAPSFALEFKQSTFRNLGPTEIEHLLRAVGSGATCSSVDHVSDLKIEPRELADRGVRFIKVPAVLLLDPGRPRPRTLTRAPASLSELLGCFGIHLIAEKIEGERAVVATRSTMTCDLAKVSRPHRPGRCGRRAHLLTAGPLQPRRRQPDGSSNAAPNPNPAPPATRCCGDRQCRAGAPGRRTRPTGTSYDLTALLVERLRDLVDGTKVVLSDIWGAADNGLEAFPEACEALHTNRQQRAAPSSWITNAPRPAYLGAAAIAQARSRRRHL